MSRPGSEPQPVDLDKLHGVGPTAQRYWTLLADAARASRQLPSDPPETHLARPWWGGRRVTVAAYQAAIREQREYVVAQIPGVGWHGGPDLAAIVEWARHTHPTLGTACRTYRHRRMLPDGRMIDVDWDGSESTARPSAVRMVHRRLWELRMPGNTENTEDVGSYFATKAGAVMVRAGGDPAAAGPLTAWAQAAHADPAYDVGHQVVVGRDGAILAEARRSSAGHRSHTAYVMSVRDDSDRDLIKGRVAAAVGALGRRHGGAILVTYSEVCAGPAVGPARRPSRSAS